MFLQWEYIKHLRGKQKHVLGFIVWKNHSKEHTASSSSKTETLKYFGPSPPEMLQLFAVT